jgi:DNA-binding transcriptional MerR regulator
VTDERLFHAAEAAREAGVTVKALRYYEQLGLIVPERSTSGYREYSSLDVVCAREVRKMSELGFSPSDSRPFLECIRAGHSAGDDCPESLSVYLSRIRSIDALIDKLHELRNTLHTRMNQAAERGFPTDSIPGKKMTSSHNQMTYPPTYRLR